MSIFIFLEEEKKLPYFSRNMYVPDWFIACILKYKKCLTWICPKVKKHKQAHLPRMSLFMFYTS